MDNFQQPVNPCHTAIFREEDMWWIGDAWDGATLDWFVDFYREVLPSNPGAVWSFLMEVRALTEMNLPGVAPSGDWLANFILQVSDLIGGYELVTGGAKFSDWMHVPECSPAVRFFIYCSDNVRMDSDVYDMMNLLLTMADLTDADIAQLRKENNGGTFGNIPVGLMSNHGLVDHPLYLEVSDEILSRWRGAATRHWREVVTAALSSVRNPATPEVTLKKVENIFLPYLHGAASITNLPKNSTDFDCNVILGAVNDHPNRGERIVGKYSHFWALDGRRFPTFSEAFQRQQGFSTDLFGGGRFTLMKQEATNALSKPDSIPLSTVTLVGCGLGHIMRERREALGLAGRDVPDEWVNLIFS